MGMYDTITIEQGIEISFPDLDSDPSCIKWQTKTFEQPALVEYKITTDGRLFKEDASFETVPEEDRPGYDPESGGFENKLNKSLGALKKVRNDWIDTEYHGIVEIHEIVDDEYVSYDLKFTDGTLVAVTQNN